MRLRLVALARDEIGKGRLGLVADDPWAQITVKMTAIGKVIEPTSAGMSTSGIHMVMVSFVSSGQ